MRYFVCALAALVLAAPATAAKGRHKPHDAITVTVAGDQAVFAVHLDAALAPQLAYSLWVGNVCTDSEGVTASAEYSPGRVGRQYRALAGRRDRRTVHHRRHQLHRLARRLP